MGNVIVASVVKVFLVRAQLDFCMPAGQTVKAVVILILSLW